MASILIVEDQSADLRVAADVAQSLGVAQVDARKTAASAKLYLETALEKHVPLPDLVILDLDLGYDSGHELLRFWHTNERMSRTRMIVWTALGKEQQELCKLFNVDAVVPKWEGTGALKAAIEPCLKRSSDAEKPKLGRSAS